MADSGIMLVMAYPETIVKVAEEWYSPYLRYFGIGKKDYVRAGHAALVLINRQTGKLEYHDFGRYITPEPNGRVRGRDTDHELDFPLTAKIEGNRILNLNEILEFLATNPQFTHGDGKLIASVCDAVDYDLSRQHIDHMQEKEFIRYAAFISDACNCARFVTDALIAGLTDRKIIRRLKRSKFFTPSTVGNVLIADTQNQVFQVSEYGEIGDFKSNTLKENLKHFLDQLPGHEPNWKGTIYPTEVNGLTSRAQWLGGIAAGAWFELRQTGHGLKYRFRRISPKGHIDTDGLYMQQIEGFIYEDEFEFVHYSNCKYFHIRQNGRIFRFDLIESFS